MKDQFAYWQTSKTSIYFFPNKKDERYFKFLGISDQSSDQCTLKIADPEIFSFWVNGIFARKQALFDNCELMQSCNNNCESVQQFTFTKLVHTFGK